MQKHKYKYKGNKTDRRAKLLDGLVCEPVDSFTTDTGHLNDHQWGVRRCRSTEELLVYLNETWKAVLDNRKVVGVVYVDFQKTFDTVSQEILIYKPQSRYGTQWRFAAADGQLFGRQEAILHKLSQLLAEFHRDHSVSYTHLRAQRDA